MAPKTNPFARRQPPQPAGKIEHISFDEKPGFKSAPKLPQLDKNDKQVREFLNLVDDHSTKQVHQTSDPVEQMLKFFDFMTEYGPVAGITRLERWERAQKLGKNPPQIVKQILETEQGQTDPKYSQSYLYQHL